MNPTPFDFKTRDIDSAIRFGHFAIQEAKAAIKEIERSSKFDMAIRVLRALSKKAMDYDYIRQTMDKGRLERQLVKDLNVLSQRCSRALGLLKRDRNFPKYQELIEKILRDLIILETQIDSILGVYEGEVEKGEGLYAGIDGGGTGTRCIISRKDGKVIGAGRGGPSDIGRVGAIRSFNSIVTSLKEACEKAGINFKTARFVRICAGVVLRSKEIHRRNEELLAKYIRHFYPGNIRDAIILPDHVVSWYTCTQGRPGIMIMGGTGHMHYGYDPTTGKEAVGFDYEAEHLNTFQNVHLSGRFIAYHAAKYLYGRWRAKKTQSIMYQEVDAAFRKGKLFRKYKDRGVFLHDLLEDINRFFELGFKMGPNISHNVVLNRAHGVLEVNDIPELAEYVFVAAQKGDRVAKNIILRGAKTTAKYVEYIATEIGLHNKRFIIGLTGSIILNEMTKLRLRKQIKLFEPAIQPEDIVMSNEPAQETALRIAINNIRFY
jgi:N-acetylglucosamine kinase-like BadF-type ATPase